ncbi:MAG: beta-phosphoglucomutase [Planctomycetota bacterium]|jgi:beta-phosphoglucomutase
MKRAKFGVIFDMDGVLVLSGDAHWESWRAVAADRGVTLTHELFLSTFGQVNEDCIAVMFGSQTEAEEVERIADEKERAYRDIVRANVPLAPGLFELLAQLQEAGAAIAVGSSAPPENVDLVLDAGGLREFISVSVNGKQVAQGKPAPDVFLIAAEQLGLTPDRCIVVEDAPVGVQAARAAGMRAVAVTTTNTAKDLEEAGAHHIAADLQALQLANLIGPDLL